MSTELIKQISDEDVREQVEYRDAQFNMAKLLVLARLHSQGLVGTKSQIALAECQFVNNQRERKTINTQIE